MFKRTTIIATLVAVSLALASVVQSAQAAPVTVKHQVIAVVWLKQNTNEARLSLSTVDGAPMKRLKLSALRRGVIIADDMGRMLAMRGEATLEYEGRSFHDFRFVDLHTDMPGLRVVRVTHISLGVFTGDDWQHPYETAVCGSPSLSIDACLALWHPD